MLGNNSICCWNNWWIQVVFLQIRVRSFHITIKLMEIEKGKVKIDEIDLGFCLIHVFYRDTQI